jgi:hypothetical protein
MIRTGQRVQDADRGGGGGEGGQLQILMAACASH